jgi:predicted Zn-dependent protease
MFKTSMHEFGHALGCQHNNNKWDIMYPYILPGLTSISWKDLRVVKNNYKEYLR